MTISKTIWTNNPSMNLDSIFLKTTSQTRHSRNSNSLNADCVIAISSRFRLSRYFRRGMPAELRASSSLVTDPPVCDECRVCRTDNTGMWLATLAGLANHCLAQLRPLSPTCLLCFSSAALEQGPILSRHVTMVDYNARFGVFGTSVCHTYRIGAAIC